MRRLILPLVCLCLLLSACGDDTPDVSTGGPLPTPRPAPTVAGISIEPPPVSVAEPVAIGLSARQSLNVRALPGVDQPLLGQTAASAELDFTGEVFQTEDGITWWRVNFNGLQGWVQPDIGLRGPATDVTETVTAAIGTSETFATPDALADKIGALFATATGAEEVLQVDTALTANSATNTLDLLGGVGDDDLQLGLRLVINATNDGGNWLPSSVQQYPLCTKNVTPAGACG